MSDSAAASREITAAVVREKGAFQLAPVVLEPPRDDDDDCSTPAPDPRRAR
ncbi:hypothetical protein [Blastococcus colisei]|uniref:hypothetical protein n=1 Tax=Blastococcus colisei TaxID=1564162 RepID=UPI0014771BB2|nr:hypothetical protein [Blastococcus colisei]